jgi:hypothetical protein
MYNNLSKRTKIYITNKVYNESCFQKKELAEKVGNECAKAESAKEAPRKPNPKGRPKYRLSLVLHSVINYLKKKKRKGCWFFMGAF